MTKSAEQIASELVRRSWEMKEPVEVRNFMRRLARILRFGSDRLDIR